ncbi:TMAO reductase system sensor histidine kinase/response regulator TorS [Ferrimonas sp. SCSIO 43195]|uniref:TMAO reductase system sensor histidine kinase/response regulator TorS n=1 Tax=Ferrimonas sp. SCSIO 43195 TaxID=2822844 RepID=UPI002075385B|nr:TMAO reductase system sensor histidine kinase/response regulator TorS [Ferrimonas sp. SCSIO 43195]USD35695.1 TMAO reductase system sensor histidine kinase/response regulator TorS [Ferrimonas sp. SCSIO 43195]
MPKSSLASKLLVAFLFVASLSAFSAFVGWMSLSQLKDRHDGLAQRAVPVLNLSRSIAEQGGRIVLSGQFLSQVQSVKELERVSQALDRDLTALAGQLTQLEALKGEPGNGNAFLGGDEVRRILNQLVEVVGERIELNRRFQREFARVNQLALDVANLVDSQLANAQTAIVARSLALYQPRGNLAREVDDLVEVDLLQLRRMNELKYDLVRLRQQLVLLPQSVDPMALDGIERRFNELLSYLPLMVGEVQDPERRQEMTTLLDQVASGRELYSMRRQQLLFEDRMVLLNADIENEFSQLNTRMDQLLNRANLAINTASSQADDAYRLSRIMLVVIGLMALFIGLLVVWKVVLKDVVYRINYYTDALLRLSQGELDIQVSRQGQDELSRLAGAIETFKDTARAKGKAEEELRQQHRVLEQTVSERTVELSLVNQKLSEQLKVVAKARRQAEEASRAKTTFLATISHEIRTPMNGILGTAELLDQNNLTAEQQRQLDVIRRSGESLLEVINDVLDYSKIEAGHLELCIKPMALDELVREVAATLSMNAEEKGIELQLQLDCSLAEGYLCDRSKFRQILVNLISNAIKFTERGRVTVTVETLGRDQGNDRLRLSVADTGIGIEADRQGIIFQPFRQASHQHTPGGTGLGLSISKRIAELMRGRLSVVSEPGQGSTFIFELTLQRCGAPVTAPQVAVPVAPLTLLVVEDNPTNQLVIAGYLQKLKLVYRMADDGKQAMQLCQQGPFDVALVDINLPDTDGSELQQHLRDLHQRQFGKALPCIAMSAHVFSEQVDRFLGAGFDAFLAKPLRLAALSQTLAGYGADVAVSTHQPVAETADSNGILDSHQLQQDLGVLGREVISTMIVRFEEDTQALLQQLGQDSDWSAGLHRLKGGAGSLGLMALSRWCGRHEQAANQRQQLLPLLRQQVESGLGALKGWLQQQG